MTPAGSGRDARQRGSITLLFVIVVPVLLFGVGGLVLDGGGIITTKRAAINQAEQAARAGAQGLATEAVRAGGGHLLDAARAQEAAMSYLGAIGRSGSVDVAGDRVSVTVTVSRPMKLLPLPAVRVSGTASARNVRGVVVAET